METVPVGEISYQDALEMVRESRRRYEELSRYQKAVGSFMLEAIEYVSEWQEKHPMAYPQVNLWTDGYTVAVELSGICLWNSEDDMRPTDEDGEYMPLAEYLDKRLAVESDGKGNATFTIKGHHDVI